MASWPSKIAFWPQAAGIEGVLAASSKPQRAFWTPAAGQERVLASQKGFLARQNGVMDGQNSAQANQNGVLASQNCVLAQASQNSVLASQNCVLAASSRPRGRFGRQQQARMASWQLAGSQNSAQKPSRPVCAKASYRNLDIDKYTTLSNETVLQNY